MYKQIKQIIINASIDTRFPPSSALRHTRWRAPRTLVCSWCAGACPGVLRGGLPRKAAEAPRDRSHCPWVTTTVVYRGKTNQSFRNSHQYSHRRSHYHCPLKLHRQKWNHYLPRKTAKPCKHLETKTTGALLLVATTAWSHQSSLHFWSATAERTKNMSTFPFGHWWPCWSVCWTALWGAGGAESFWQRRAGWPGVSSWMCRTRSSGGAPATSPFRRIRWRPRTLRVRASSVVKSSSAHT